MKCFLFLILLLSSCREVSSHIENYSAIPSFKVPESFDPLKPPDCGENIKGEEKLRLKKLKGIKSLGYSYTYCFTPRNTWAVKDDRIVCHDFFDDTLMVTEHKNGRWIVTKKVKGTNCIDAGDEIYCFKLENHFVGEEPESGPYIFKSNGHFNEFNNWAFLGKKMNQCAVFGLLPPPQLIKSSNDIFKVREFYAAPAKENYSLPALLPGVKFTRVPDKISIVNNQTGKKRIINKKYFSHLLRAQDISNSTEPSTRCIESTEYKDICIGIGLYMKKPLTNYAASCVLPNGETILLGLESETSMAYNSVTVYKSHEPPVVLKNIRYSLWNYKCIPSIGLLFVIFRDEVINTKRTNYAVPANIAALKRPDVLVAFDLITMKVIKTIDLPGIDGFTINNYNTEKNLLILYRDGSYVNRINLLKLEFEP